MTELLQALLNRHRQMVDRLEQGEADDVFLDDIHALLDDLRLAGEVVSSSPERAHLRTLILFWSGTAFDYTGVYPTVTLLPVDVGGGEPSSAEPRRSPPPLLWLVAGGASVAVIAAALAIIGSLARTGGAADVAPPTPATALQVQYVMVEEGLGGGSTPTAGSTTFCHGTSDVVFHFGLAGFQPDMVLEWELRREGATPITRPASPYGEQNESLTVQIGSDGSGGFQSGHYDMVLAADGVDVWVEPFQVLDIRPRAFGLLVSDVPSPSNADVGRPAFEPGVRVLYLHYAFEGLCSGSALSHELRLGGELVQRVEQMGHGRPEGEAVAVFQVASEPVFSPGEYQIVTTIAGEEQARVEFTIR